MALVHKRVHAYAHTCIIVVVVVDNKATFLRVANSIKQVVKIAKLCACVCAIVCIEIG